LIYQTAEFVFEAPPAIHTAKRVLIKPSASYPTPYPVSTSRDMLAAIIDGIRKVSDADILLLEGTPTGEPVYPIYKALGYDFPRVLTLDVKDCTWVEVDNPLPKPFAVPTFWIPNVVLSSDYLITLAPLKILGGNGDLSLMNLLTVLPKSKYSGIDESGFASLYSLGIDRVIADLYFTMPFDLGIIEGQQKLISSNGPYQGDAEDYGKVFMGEPYQIDGEASEALGIKTNYLDLIKAAKEDFET